MSSEYSDYIQDRLEDRVLTYQLIIRKWPDWEEIPSDSPKECIGWRTKKLEKMAKTILRLLKLDCTLSLAAEGAIYMFLCDGFIEEKIVNLPSFFSVIVNRLSSVNKNDLDLTLSLIDTLFYRTTPKPEEVKWLADFAEKDFKSANEKFTKSVCEILRAGDDIKTFLKADTVSSMLCRIHELIKSPDTHNENELLRGLQVWGIIFNCENAGDEENILDLIVTSPLFHSKSSEVRWRILELLGKLNPKIWRTFDDQEKIKKLHKFIIFQFYDNPDTVSRYISTLMAFLHENSSDNENLSRFLKNIHECLLEESDTMIYALKQNIPKGMPVFPLTPEQEDAAWELISETLRISERLCYGGDAIGPKMDITTVIWLVRNTDPHPEIEKLVNLPYGIEYTAFQTTEEQMLTREQGAKIFRKFVEMRDASYFFNIKNQIAVFKWTWSTLRNFLNTWIMLSRAFTDTFPIINSNVMNYCRDTGFFSLAIIHLLVSRDPKFEPEEYLKKRLGDFYERFGAQFRKDIEEDVEGFRFHGVPLLEVLLDQLVEVLNSCTQAMYNIDVLLPRAWLGQACITGLLYCFPKLGMKLSVIFNRLLRGLTRNREVQAKWDEDRAIEVERIERLFPDGLHNEKEGVDIRNCLYLYDEEIRELARQHQLQNSDEFIDWMVIRSKILRISKNQPSHWGDIIY